MMMGVLPSGQDIEIAIMRVIDIYQQVIVAKGRYIIEEVFCDWVRDLCRIPCEGTL